MSTTRKGWKNDPANSRYQAVFNDTSIFDITATALTTRGSAGFTVGTGNATLASGDLRVTAGNGRYGPVNTFGTTEPTQTAVFDAGTAPVGAITESSGLFASTTVLRKIIADGTASNVG